MHEDVHYSEIAHENMFFFAPMPESRMENMKIKLHQIVFLFISILILTSAVSADVVKIKGDIAGVDRITQTMLLSTSEGFVQLNLAGSVLKRNGVRILPEQMLIGERVTGTYDSATFNAIEIKLIGGYVDGFITSIEAGPKLSFAVTITAEKIKPITIYVTQTTILLKNDQPIKVFDYNIGEYAKVYYQPQTMIAWKFLGWQIEEDPPIGINVKGYLVKIEMENQRSAGGGRVTISSETGKLFVMDVNEETKITLNGTPAGLRDLDVGDYVTACSLITGHAISITATRKHENLNFCTGYILKIAIKGDLLPLFELVIRSNDYRNPLVLSLRFNAEVYKDGKRVRPFALKPADFVTILYDETKMSIVRIEAWTTTK
jgi:hypothetical protein